VTATGTHHRYRAFISYSHRDERWAVALQNYLERFHVPRTLRSRYEEPRPLRPIFRDQTDLTSGQLPSIIEDALRESAALIVLCSPDAARSTWVDAEITRFKQLHGEHGIFPLILDGVPHADDPARECFPSALTRAVTADGATREAALELLAPNIHDSGGRRDAFLKLAAALLGVGFDELKQRETQRRQRRSAAITAGALVVAAVTTVLAFMAYSSQREAELRRAQADDLIGFMVGDLRARLEPIGRIDVLDEVGSKAMEYLSSLPPGEDPAVMDRRAMTLRQIGEVRVLQGRYEDGLSAFLEAMAIYQRLLAVDDPDPERMYHLAHTHFWIADSHIRRLDFEAAEREIHAYRDTAQWLADNYPDNTAYLLELAQAESNLGTIAYRRSDFAAARSHFRASETVTRRIITREPDNDVFVSTLAATLSWLGSAEVSIGNLDRGLNLHDEVVEIGRRTVARSNDMRDRRYLAADLQVLSADYHRLGRFDEAMTIDREAVGLLEELVAFDPDNRHWAYALARARSLRARHQLTACELGGVARLLNDSQSGLERLMAIDANDADTQIDLANVHVERARRSAVDGAIAEARASAATGHDAMQEILRGRPDDVTTRREFARAAAVRVLVDRLAGDPEAAGTIAAAALDGFDGVMVEDTDTRAWLDVVRGDGSDADGRLSRVSTLIPHCAHDAGSGIDMDPDPGNDAWSTRGED